MTAMPAYRARNADAASTAATVIRNQDGLSRWRARARRVAREARMKRGSDRTDGGQDEDGFRQNRCV
jgi:hypothetical protein